MSSRIRAGLAEAVAVVGPWPLRPFASGFCIWFFTAAFSSGRLVGEGQPFTGEMAAIVFVKALLPALCLAGAFALMRRFSPSTASSLPRYVAAVIAGVVLAIAVRMALGELPAEGFGSLPGAFIVGVLRGCALVLTIQAVIGVAGRRLGAQVARTDAALALARQQQALLLDADERTRQQVSSLLHDRVQAGLIAACLELQDVVADAPASVRSGVAPVIARLEELRALDVRRAARALSPDLADNDLLAVLEEIASTYAPGMLVTVDVTPVLLQTATRPDAQVLLGCTRIIEQALLNAAVHGRARHCHVAVGVTDGNGASTWLRITVDDDGVGVAADAGRGLGTALTETWIRVLEGSWTRQPGAVSGTRLLAEVPCSRM